MTTQELVERLRHLEADAKDLRTAADRLLEADEMEAEIKRLREALHNTAAYNNPPCAICGYNGPNYYQPETHSCAAHPAPCWSTSRRRNR